MKYFENFPKIRYTFDKNTINVNLVTNILARSTFLKDIVNNVDVSYEYLIQDTDTPEVIAHKAYGDAYRNWIILMFNNIINPYYDWPMKPEVLDNFIINKYNQTIDEAKSTIHHYEQTLRKITTTQGVTLSDITETTTIGEYEINYTTGAITARALPSTADTSLSVGTDVVTYDSYVLTIIKTNKAVSNYTYELEENEKRRKIKILDPRYIQRVENEFREIMSNG